MNIHMIRLGMAFFFLVMSIGLFSRKWLFTPEQLAAFSESRLDLAAAFALLLFGWNISRWYAARSQMQRNAERLSMRDRHHHDAKHGEEYNPEFDFDKK